MKIVPLTNKIILLFLTTTAALGAFAQKLPGKQEVSVQAPASIAIDGKLTEWNGQLQAINKSSKLSYTVSNDDSNLYFTFQATDAQAVQKVLANNITVWLNPVSDAKKKDVFTFTAPALNQKDKRNVLSNLKFQAMKAADNNLAEDDSVLIVTNKKLLEGGMGKAGGAPAVESNEKAGIKSVVALDNKNAVTYELAIPLSVFAAAGKATQFHYSIVLNGDGEPYTRVSSDGSAQTSSTGVLTGAASAVIPYAQREFNADYTLAVK